MSKKVEFINKIKFKHHNTMKQKLYYVYYLYFQLITNQKAILKRNKSKTLYFLRLIIYIL